MVTTITGFNTKKTQRIDDRCQAKIERFYISELDSTLGLYCKRLEFK